MTSISNILATEADILRCGYNVGFFDNQDIESWADRQIEATENPSTELIDLAMIQQTHPLDVLRLLRSFGAVDPTTTIETQIGFIGLLVHQNRISTQLAIRSLWALIHEPGTTQEQQSHIYSFDDGYDLAVAGSYGTIDDVERELRAFLSPYSQRLAEQNSRLVPSTV